MGENVDFIEELYKTFDLKKQDANLVSALGLAYIGDCIFDLVVKSQVIHAGNRPVNDMHKMTSHIVNAQAQSEMMRKLQDVLTDEERRIYKRGRNSRSVSPAKNQSVTDYRRATGFEALMGYLFLEGQYERMLLLMKMGLDHLKEKGITIDSWKK